MADQNKMKSEIRGVPDVNQSIAKIPTPPISASGMKASNVDIDLARLTAWVL